MYEGGSTTATPAGATAGPPGGDRGAVQERNFWVCLLLTVVTLGIYQYYYHYKSHEELCRELGRENREVALFWTWVGINLVGTIVVVYFALEIVRTAIGLGEASESRVIEESFDIVLNSVIMLLAAMVAAIGALVVFIIYVNRQYELLQNFRQTAGLPNKPGVGWFFGFYYGAAIAVDLLTMVLGSIVFKPLAYHNLVEHHNEVRRYFDGRLPQLSLPRAAPAGATGAAMGTAPSWADPAATRAGPAAHFGAGAEPASGGAVAGAGADVPRAQGEGWGRRPDEHTFSVGGRRGPAGNGGDASATGPVVRQAFKCPRCHAHVEAEGQPGTTVDLHCGGCGETGRVPLPDRV